MEEHTFDYCKTESMIPAISVRGPKAEAEKVFDQNIQKQMKKMLDSYVKPDVDRDTLEKMHQVLLDKGIDPELIRALDQY